VALEPPTLPLSTLQASDLKLLALPLTLTLALAKLLKIVVIPPQKYRRHEVNKKAKRKKEKKRKEAIVSHVSWSPQCVDLLRAQLLASCCNIV
jgi:hypothetical protein